ncbi:MAG: hypothetical protein HC794_10380, partial [Nitrospiraceae bacterium]|nr:hypothetical protein [Nitrospiraceae bacterium]
PGRLALPRHLDEEVALDERRDLRRRAEQQVRVRLLLGLVFRRQLVADLRHRRARTKLIFSLMPNALLIAASKSRYEEVTDMVRSLDKRQDQVLIVLGTVTAVYGVLAALFNTDIKRVLAFSTIENIGIIFIGLGLALGFGANAMEWAAALALTAAGTVEIAAVKAEVVDTVGAGDTFNGGFLAGLRRAGLLSRVAGAAGWAQQSVRPASCLGVGRRFRG